MSASVSLFKKDRSKKASQDSPSKSNSDSYKENSSTIQLQSFQDKADELVGGESQNNTTQLKEKANNTGLPDQLKAGVEQLSGHSLDDVKVHYNSSKPAQLKAHGYAEGNQIHLAQGQEKHLGHEAWHVVQQKENRVSPTKQINGVGVNDNPSLEKEADTMGAKAASADPVSKESVQLKLEPTPGKGVVQGFFGFGSEKKEEAAPSAETETTQKEGKEEEKEANESEESTKNLFEEKGPEALSEMLDLGKDGDETFQAVKGIEDPSKEPESVSSIMMKKITNAKDTVSKGVFSIIASLASPITKIVSGVATGYQKWNQWTNLKELGEKQEASGKKKDDKITYTVGKLAKGFIVQVNEVIQGIISFVKNLLAIIPEGLSKAAAAGLQIYEGIYSLLVKAYAVPKRWYQLFKGDKNKKDINSNKIIEDAFKNPPDDNAIDFIWALNLPAIRGSGFESIDILKNKYEKAKSSTINAAKGGLKYATGIEMKKEESPQYMAEMINSAGSEGKNIFKLLITEGALTDSTKEKIREEIKEAMTGFGT